MTVLNPITSAAIANRTREELIDNGVPIKNTVSQALDAVNSSLARAKELGAQGVGSRLYQLTDSFLGNSGY